MIVLHLMPEAAWQSWAAGDYAPDSLTTEGFVHCTGTDDLMLAVANRFYGDAGEAVVVSLDTDRLRSEVRWEAPAHPDGSAALDDQPRFPHVYGPLERDAVTGARRLVRDADGAFAGYAPMD